MLQWRRNGEADITHNHTRSSLPPSLLLPVGQKTPSVRPHPAAVRLFESFTTARIHILITRRNGYHPRSSPYSPSCGCRTLSFVEMIVLYPVIGLAGGHLQVPSFLSLLEQHFCICSTGATI